MSLFNSILVIAMMRHPCIPHPGYMDIYIPVSIIYWMKYMTLCKHTCTITWYIARLYTHFSWVAEPYPTKPHDITHNVIPTSEKMRAEERCIDYIHNKGSQNAPKWHLVRMIKWNEEIHDYVQKVSYYLTFSSKGDSRKNIIITVLLPG